jgi:hypothetical protein
MVALAADTIQVLVSGLESAGSNGESDTESRAATGLPDSSLVGWA